MFLAKVQFDPKVGVNRGTVIDNHHVVNLTLKHLGTRVTVSALELHIRAFYDLMHLNPGGALICD